jgi:GTPase SAR1 family protein
LHRHIEEQLHDGIQEATNTRILVVHGLGGSGKSQLVLSYVREYRKDYSAIFWVEAEQKVPIEQDCLQIYWMLFEPRLVTRIDVVSAEDAAVAVKRWFHG